MMFPKPTYSKKPKSDIPAAQRKRLLARANGLCEGCGNPPSDFRGLKAHHIELKKMGGTRKIYRDDELEMLCGRCHSERHNIKEA